MRCWAGFDQGAAGQLSIGDFHWYQRSPAGDITIDRQPARRRGVGSTRGSVASARGTCRGRRATHARVGLAVFLRSDSLAH